MRAREGEAMTALLVRPQLMSGVTQDADHVMTTTARQLRAGDIVILTRNIPVNIHPVVPGRLPHYFKKRTAKGSTMIMTRLVTEGMGPATGVLDLLDCDWPDGSAIVTATEAMP
jgi:hypothetical protein